MRQRMHRTATALVIAAIAGTCASVGFAQSQPNQRNPQTQPQQQQRPADRQIDSARTGRTGFVKASALLGSNVVNDNGETLGEVDDMIVDRGTGWIDFVVLSKGGLLGIGDKKVAIPYSSFAFDHSQDKFKLNVPPEYIENAAKFRPDQWVELDKESWTDQFGDMWEGDTRRSDPDWTDPYARGIDGAEKVTVKGTITDVRRDRTAQGSEQIVVTLSGADGTMRKVVLGPSWYVMSQPGAPMRGQAIEVQGFRMPRDGEDRLIARRATIGGKSFDLRDEKGAARWNAATDHDRTVWGSGRASPLVLLSDLIGMDVRARDQDGGEVEGAVIEVESGRVALLTLDPDDNFLGIGDELRLVPWSVASIGHDAVRVDADRDMLLASQKLPDDVSVFSTPERLRPVYGAFRVEPGDFPARQRTEWKQGSPVSQWTEDGEIARAYRSGDIVKVTGKVDGVRAMAVPGTSIDSMAVDVTTPDGTRRTVVLGPKWFMDQQTAKINSGDRVNIEARAATIGGQRTLIAGSIETDAGRRIDLWNGTSPAWTAR